jgi:hypothetical protein
MNDDDRLVYDVHTYIDLSKYTIMPPLILVQNIYYLVTHNALT